MSLLDTFVASSLPFLPRALLWRVARRYIAGDTVGDALRVVAELRDDGCRATLDVLGEDVDTEESARAAAADYGELLERLDAEGLPAGISIKLSQLGLRFAEDLAFDLVERIASRANELGRFVRIDMEDSSLTSKTLDIYRRLAGGIPTSEGGGVRVGVVLQAALRRSPKDLEGLLELGAERVDIRVCKGIYREPEPIAFQKRGEIQAQYVRLVDRLLESHARAAIATHDPVLVDAALDRLSRLDGESRGRHEFQMLHGVGNALRPRIHAAGVRLRVYVPFGTHWHAYSLRRLRENPTIARYVLKDLLSPLAAK